MRKRLRTGSDGTSKPGKSGQSRANRRIDGFLTKLPVQILRFFRSELALLSGENAILVRKKGPYSSATFGGYFFGQDWPFSCAFRKVLLSACRKGGAFRQISSRICFCSLGRFQKPQLESRVWGRLSSNVIFLFGGTGYFGGIGCPQDLSQGKIFPEDKS